MDTSVVEVWRLLGLVVGSLVIATAVVCASKLVMKQARGLRQIIRNPTWLAAVDESDDDVIVRLAQLTALPPEAWSAFLMAFFPGVS